LIIKDETAAFLFKPSQVIIPKQQESLKISGSINDSSQPGSFNAKGEPTRCFGNQIQTFAMVQG
jgi:hypothetical protein